MAICSSQRLRGEVDNQEVMQARRWHVCKVGLLLREIVLHDDILRLSPPQHVAIALDLAREVVPHKKRVTRRFERVHAVVVPRRHSHNVCPWTRSRT